MELNDDVITSSVVGMGELDMSGAKKIHSGGCSLTLFKQVGHFLSRANQARRLDISARAHAPVPRVRV